MKNLFFLFAILFNGVVFGSQREADTRCIETSSNLILVNDCSNSEGPSLSVEALAEEIKRLVVHNKKEDCIKLLLQWGTDRYPEIGKCYFVRFKASLFETLKRSGIFFEQFEKIGDFKLKVRDLPGCYNSGQQNWDLSNKHIDDLNGLQDNTPRLVNLSGNCFKNLHGLPCMAGLTSLILSDNELKGLRFLPTDLPNVDTLELNNCQLADEDLVNVLELPMLKHLELEKNQLTKIPDLGRLLQLEQVRLANNGIIDDENNSLLPAKLQVLNLSGNKLTNRYLLLVKLPEAWFNNPKTECVSIKKTLAALDLCLDLSGNPLIATSQSDVELVKKLRSNVALKPHKFIA